MWIDDVLAGKPSLTVSAPELRGSRIQILPTILTNQIMEFPEMGLPLDLPDVFDGELTRNLAESILLPKSIIPFANSKSVIGIHSSQVSMGSKWCYSGLIATEDEVIVPGQVAHYQGTLTDSIAENVAITVSQTDLQATLSVNWDLQINLKVGYFSSANYSSRFVLQFQNCVNFLYLDPAEKVNGDNAGHNCLVREFPTA